MDLSCRYMGFQLKNPLIASASPMTASVDSIHRLGEAGIAAIVLPSLFEEQIDAEIRAIDHIITQTSDCNPDGPSYFPDLDFYRTTTDSYLELIEGAKKAVDVPVIASLNGSTGEGWISYAKQMEKAGADALELNIYWIPTNPDQNVEQRYVDIVKAVRGAIQIPVAVKVGPYFSSFAQTAKALDQAGADALVLFNRFYQPDIDLEKMELLANLHLSSPDEIRLPLLWTAVLYKKLNASIATSCGVSGPEEVLKYLLSGADAVMTASSLLRHGPAHVEKILKGVSDWMEQRGYQSIDQMRGILSQEKISNPEAFERANYIKIIQGYRTEFN